MAVAILLVAFGSLAATTTLIVNGGLGFNRQSNGSFGASSLTGGNGMPSDELRKNRSGAAQDGNAFVVLNTNKSIGITPTVNGTGLIDQSFASSSRPNAGIRNQLDFGSGSLTGTVVAGVSGADWPLYTYRVNMRTLGNAVPSFSAAGPSDGSPGNIPVTAAVPEPETYAMLLTGLGLLAAIARRQNMTQAA